jgi:hypothetical protein
MQDGKLLQRWAPDIGGDAAALAGVPKQPGVSVIETLDQK